MLDIIKVGAATDAVKITLNRWMIYVAEETFMFDEPPL